MAAVAYEPFADSWYETKTALSMFEELPSPNKETPPPFGLQLPHHYPIPAPAVAVHVPLPPQQEQQQQQPQQPLLHHHHHHQLVADPSRNITLLLTAAASQATPLNNTPLAAPLPTPMPTPLPLHPLIADSQTQLQLDEFECVFGEVEQSYGGAPSSGAPGGALTPPQSPGNPARPAAAAAVQAVGQYQQLPPLQDDFAALTPHSQQQQLIREVDELVHPRTPRVEDAVGEYQWPAWPAPPSPCTSSNSSSSSNSLGSTDSPAPRSPETDDPDWVPVGSSVGDSVSGQDSGPASPAPSGKAPSGGAQRKRGSSRRGKPYTTNPEDKRIRKKEQNKNAATRYRMKKKAEVEVILGEENELKDRNDQLKSKVGDLSQEIRYLKSLMREVLTRSGALK